MTGFLMSDELLIVVHIQYIHNLLAGLVIIDIVRRQNDDFLVYWAPSMDIFTLISIVLLK